MHSKSSFTLIELLVVIAIVGILAGIIIVSMSGATDQATMAKAKVFSNSMRDSMSLNLTSEWLMSEGSGQTITDNWGGNTGTLGGTTSVEATDPTWITSGCVSDNCLSFDGTNDSVVIGSPANLNFKAGQDFSLSVWVKYSDNSNYHLILGKYCDSTVPGYWIDVLGNKIRLRVGDSGGAADVSTTQTYNDNKWHNIVAVFDRDALGYLYVDGAMMKSGSISARSGDTGSGIFRIGAGTSTYFSGMIDEARIFNSTLSFSQIKQQYLADLQRLYANKGITQEEYNQRLASLNNYCFANK